jgi:mannosyl-oligosaccharide alpha-1,2-mannosidase
VWLYENKKDKNKLDNYLKTMEATNEKLIKKSSNGFVYAGEYNNGNLSPKMGHLTCFVGGLYALTYLQVDSLSSEEKNKYKELAIEITNTCHESYIRTPTRLGPEAFTLNDNQEFTVADRYYILRPEVIESYFYLWRMTKDQKYRDWAWDAVEAIEKHCKTDSGYSGLRDVTSNNPEKDDVQQSFFFAETLKYLYLIFSDDNVLPFSDYVFNTEAHPFLIKKNS